MKSLMRKLIFRKLWIYSLIIFWVSALVVYAIVHLGRTVLDVEWPEGSMFPGQGLGVTLMILQIVSALVLIGSALHLETKRSIRITWLLRLCFVAINSALCLGAYTLIVSVI